MGAQINICYAVMKVRGEGIKKKKTMENVLVLITHPFQLAK